MSKPIRRERLEVRDWHRLLAGGSRAEETACATVETTGYDRVARFRNIDPSIEQPPLQDNVLAIHLGGAKRVTRSHGRHRETFDVAEGAATLMPACESYRWRTEGPVDFVHLILNGDLLGRTAADDCDVEPRSATLRSQVGLTDPLLLALVRALLAELEQQWPARLYCDSLLATLGCHLLRHYSEQAPGGDGRIEPSARSKGGLAGWQLRRVLDYMHVNLAQDIRLAELVALTGLSRSQFFHAFGRSMACSPHLHLTRLRVRRATSLLADTDLPIGRIAVAVGWSQSQLAASFRQSVGVSPNRYRRRHAACVTPSTSAIDIQ